MNKKLLLNLLLLIFPTLLLAQVTIPKGYEVLKESPANGKEMGKIFMLFDDDLRKDEAVIIKNEATLSNYKLLIYLSNLNKQVEIDLPSTSDFQIYPIQLTFKNKVLQFGCFEDGTAAFGRFIKLRFDPPSRRIKVIGYDVSYRASPTENIDKSYNLLTGNYVVKRTSYKANGQTKIKTFTGKNEHFKNRVFSENLGRKMFDNLDNVGSKYE
ncbi:hypothetical protein EZJ43_13280 [Pedobacter changchengzhani]|uniref:Uncharacterized protein n=1 Tax=Pedobacter changchengzhani TaxID=2529274 RepID=A0A4R5MJ75_9SPHI|nr:hypothetical protein [Pedobacter changchengzhani]TDG35588.1 hypothetical protein EZJ43_13280 [Pedobacter changchengzhani]